ncbi:MAG: carboxypeptidase-like regulatory domain-containing protein, partial [Emticicia sp.]|nr:carboxypeptidase-like regulatory domain-containing protein [Emticicia sp.]
MQKNFTKTFKLISFFLFSIQLAFAQNANLKGKITTSDGKPAEFVNVILKDLSINTSTNSEGEFYFKNISEGTHTIEISMVGFETINQNIVVENNKSNFLSLQIKVSALQLEEVVIS